MQYLAKYWMDLGRIQVYKWLFPLLWFALLFSSKYDKESKNTALLIGGGGGEGTHNKYDLIRSSHDSRIRNNSSQ